MANNKPIIFYLFDDEGKIFSKTKRISSPFNVATFNPRDPKQDVYHDPKYVTFQGGVYETSDEEEISWLKLYNNTGGKLDMGDGTFKNFKGDNVHQVKMEAPKKEVKEIINTVEKEVQQIPKTVAEMFTIEQLKQLCSEWSVSCEGAITKDEYIKFLEESNKLS